MSGKYGNRKKIHHGQKRKLYDAVGTLANSSTPTLTLDLSKGDVFSAATYTGTAAAIAIDIINAYDGAELWLRLDSNTSLDDLGSISYNGDAADTTYTGGAFNDSAQMLIHIICEDITAGASVVIIDYTDIT